MADRKGFPLRLDPYQLDQFPIRSDKGVKNLSPSVRSQLLQLAAQAAPRQLANQAGQQQHRAQAD